MKFFVVIWIIMGFVVLVTLSESTIYYEISSLDFNKCVFFFHILYALKRKFVIYTHHVHGVKASINFTKERTLHAFLSLMAAWLL